MKPGKIALLLVAAVLALPSSASAFTVRLTGDDGDTNIGDGNCDSNDVMAGNQCTLRAATDEANFSPNNDSITFDHSVFTGNSGTSTIALDFALNVDTEMTIDGGDCPGGGLSHRPCVGIDADDGNLGLSVNADADGVDVRGLAIFTGSRGIITQAGADALTVRNSWFGLNLDQDQVGNSEGLRLEGDSAVIGGSSSADRVVVAGNGTAGVLVIGDGNKLRRSYLGTKADGTTGVSTGTYQIDIDPLANDTVIGASVPDSARATTTCDGGCNVISNASDGVFDEGTDTVIKGNFIGLDKTGNTAMAFGHSGIDERGSGVTIGGDTSAERNFIASSNGSFGVFKFFGANMSVKRNYFGLNSAGTATVGSLSTALFLGANSTAARNRIAGCASGIVFDNVEGRAVRNKIGLDKDGGDLPGATGAGIVAKSNDGIVGEPGAGNTIGNSGTGILIGSGSADRNTVQGNFVGVDSSGIAHPNSGIGIHLVNSGTNVPDDNLIGGTSGASENVISNSGLDAIRLEDSNSGGLATGNQFKRNRGKDNGNPDNGEDLFIDLQGGFAEDGQGNSLGPNDAIPRLQIQDGSEAGDLTRTHAFGFLAPPGATIYLFRTLQPNGQVIKRINAFVDMATADEFGDWEANFPAIPEGQRITGLQIDVDGNASELSPAMEPMACGGDPC